jgi:hypothetical protein
MGKRERYILRNEIGLFWAGSKWSSEYPDAIILEGKRELREAENRAQFKAVRLYAERLNCHAARFMRVPVRFQFFTGILF